MFRFQNIKNNRMGQASSWIPKLTDPSLAPSLPETLLLGGLDRDAPGYQPAVQNSQERAALVRALKQAVPQVPITKVVVGGHSSQNDCAFWDSIVSHLGHLPQLQHLEISAECRGLSATALAASVTCSTLESLIVWCSLTISSTDELETLNQALHHHPSLKYVHFLQIKWLPPPNTNASSNYQISSVLRLVHPQHASSVGNVAASNNVTSSSDGQQEQQEKQQQDDDTNPTTPTTTTRDQDEHVVTATKKSEPSLASLLMALSTIPHLTRLQLAPQFSFSRSTGLFQTAQHALQQLLDRRRTTLQVLVLHNVGLTASHAAVMAQALRGNTTLYHLDVRFNGEDLSAGGLGYQYLLRILEECHLQYVDCDAPVGSHEDETCGAYLPQIHESDTDAVRLYKLVQLHCQLNRAGRFTLLKNGHATAEERFRVLEKLVVDDDDEEEEGPSSLDILYGFLTQGSNPLEFLSLLRRDPE